MQSVFAIISLSLLILFTSFEEARSNKYKYIGGWTSFDTNTAQNIARGMNTGYPNALNYAYADNLIEFVGIYFSKLTQDNCLNVQCPLDGFCNNINYFIDQNNVETCVLYRDTTAYVTVYNDINFAYTLDQCEKLCDDTPKCNLFEFLKPYNPDYFNQTQCNLFHLFENATVENAITVDPTCGDSCNDAWYVRANECKSINAAVPNSYCKNYCLFNDAKNPDYCTGVNANMKSICECNNVNNNYCYSLSPSVPNAYCKSYCHIDGTTCKVDQHMSTICACAL